MKTLKEFPQRKLKQNSAMHKYYDLVAKEFNEAGLDIETTLTAYKIDIPWTRETVKELMWKPIQNHMLRKSSTTKLNTKQVGEVYEVVNKFTCKFGIHVPFPSEY
jgi:hypothetical protein